MGFKGGGYAADPLPDIIVDFIISKGWIIYEYVGVAGIACGIRKRLLKNMIYYAGPLGTGNLDGGIVLAGDIFLTFILPA